MRILDSNNIEIVNPDFTKGYVEDDRIFIAHHDAIEPVEEVWHYEVVKEYPNGGKIVEKVIDVQGVEAVPAWDEYEDIQRWIPFPESDSVEMPDIPDDSEDNGPTDWDRIEAQIMYTALMTDTLLEE